MSITSWNRLEPRVRDRSLSSLEARVHDPAWLLGRQWQIGAFRGEDAGSAIAARVVASVGTLSRYRPGPLGSGAGQPYDVATLPLEALVEREPAHRTAERNFRLAAEAGLAFWRELDAAQLGSLRGKFLVFYGLPRLWEDRDELDAASLRFADVMANRVPDGLKLRAALQDAIAAGRPLPDQPQVTDPGERAALSSAFDRWLDWWGALDAGASPGDPDPAWIPRRLEYAFSVAGRVGTGERVLVAPGYGGDHLDWDTFDVAPGATLGAATDVAPSVLSQTTLPAPVTYPGMPRPRWWEFEDGDVHVGAVEAGREDLTRLLLMEFALIYGNDFFVVPLQLPVGALCQITDLEVTDTFGGRWSIPSVGEADGPNGGFRLFEASPTEGSGASQGRPVFLLAPSVGQTLRGAPVENVALLRDEMANMAWAVENTVLGASGLPLRRHEAWLERRQHEAQTKPDSTGPSQGDALIYRIATPPPEHWLPLLPVKVGTDAFVLQIRTMIGKPQARLSPWGRILEPNATIEDEEVPREGVHVTRCYEYARWLNGSTVLWNGRRTSVGRGEGSSGLAFDVAEHDMGSA